MVAASFLSTLFFALALAVAAHPVEQKASRAQLRFVKRVNHNPVKQDQLRVNSIIGKAGKGLSNREVINSPADNRAVTYIASIGVGNPATNCK
jgi:cathepsin E